MMRQQAVRVLTVTLVACIVLPIALLGYAGWSVHHDLRLQAERRADIELEVMTQHALKEFQTANVAIYAMNLMTRDMSDAQIRAHEPRLHDAFRELVRRLPEVQSVWIIGHDGLALVSDAVFPMPRVNVTDRDFFVALEKDNRQTYVGAVVKPKLLEKSFFSINQRRNAADGSFSGVLNVSLLPTEFEQFYRAIAAEGTELLAMVRSDGAVLAGFPTPAAPGLSLDPTQPSLMRAFAQRPDGGRATGVWPLDGVERIVSYRPVPGYDVFVIAGTSTAALRAALWSQLAGDVAFGLPATLLLMITLVIAIQRTRGLYAEAARRQTAERALEHAHRMEAFGQLTGGVAHDFNNLLMMIGASAERLRDRITDPRAARSLTTIEGAVQRGAAITRQLLAFAGEQFLEPEVIDLAEHLGRIEGMLHGSLRDDIMVDVMVEGGPCVVTVDRGELDLAVLNIAVNARDAMPNGGRLSLRVRPVTLDGGAAADWLAGTFIAIVVTDTGTGIAPEILPRVFEPFFTSKEVGKGTGLGLSQVFGFARQSGGTVTVASEVGHGTAVTIYLPPSAQAPAPPSRRHAFDEAASAGSRILLVEDNPEVAETVSDLLADYGFQVEVAASAVAALNRLKQAQPIDIVVSDVVMPGELNGIDLAHEVRRLNEGLPVLLTSGYSSGAESAIREGFAFLSKPYDIARLRDAIAAILPEPEAAPRRTNPPRPNGR